MSRVKLEAGKGSLLIIDKSGRGESRPGVVHFGGKEIGAWRGLRVPKWTNSGHSRNRLLRSRVTAGVDQPTVMEALDRLHEEVDRRAAELSARHAARLVCGRGCSACCVDDLTVFEVEAEKIRLAVGEALAHAEPHPAGGCAFLADDGSCRIYEVRPYVCRTQGLPLRWLDDDAAAEYRDICELNDGEPAIETLDEQECWTIGPFEQRLAALQSSVDGGMMRRVGLRALFERLSR
jgi:uncharacterized protein